MNHRQRRFGRGILAAVAVTGVILLLHDRFAPWLGERAPMLPFLFSVLVAAWVGGFWPGLLATGLGGMAGAYMILDPPGSMFPDQPNEWAPLFVFLAAGATISWAFDALIRARDRALESERGWRESEERFRLTADSAPVLIWMSGIDKLCTWFNRGWLDFVGRSLEQEVGNGWTENVHSEDLGRCLEVYTTSFDARREFNLEYRLRRHDGRYRWVLDHGVPRFGTGGEFTGYIGSCVDITERRAAEQARHEAEARILGTFQQADRRKDEFLAVLAHELRNPLAPVRNAAHLMKVNDLSGPELKRPADMIERQVTHMARLIDDLLDVSRIVTGVIDLRLEHVEWSDVVHAAVDACRPDIEARGHALRINLPSVPVHVRADRDRLIQVRTT